ncbi:MAG: hypothetical protein CL910_17065 [Deltaproteobacteria bacterium]|jgi:hypothetical protein|nr:hypothetical protein [Deltaproteobacteria bacterium]
MRIVVAIYESAFANHILGRLLAARPGEVAAVLRADSVFPGESLAASVWRLLRQGGLSFALLKTLETWILRLRGVGLPLDRLCRESDVPLIPVDDINTPSNQAHLAAVAPDLLVSLHFNHRIRRACLEIPRLGALNVHGALLPRNRGLFPYFWALARGEGEHGSTLHWMDDDFDTGDVILQAQVPISDQDTVFSLQWRTAERGADLLLEALPQIEAGLSKREAQMDEMATHVSWPRLRDILRLYASGRRYGFWRALTPGAPDDRGRQG